MDHCLASLHLDPCRHNNEAAAMGPMAIMDKESDIIFFRTVLPMSGALFISPASADFAFRIQAFVVQPRNFSIRSSTST